MFYLCLLINETYKIFKGLLWSLVAVLRSSNTVTYILTRSSIVRGKWWKYMTLEILSSYFPSGYTIGLKNILDRIIQLIEMYPEFWLFTSTYLIQYVRVTNQIHFLLLFNIITELWRYVYHYICILRVSAHDGKHPWHYIFLV